MEETSLKDIWKNTLNILKTKIQKSEILAWFHPSILAGLDEESQECVIGVPSVFKSDNIRGKFMDFLAQSLEESTGMENLKITIEVMSDVTIGHKLAPNIPSLMKGSEEKPSKREVYLAEGVESRLLNPRYTFENFVVGGENEMAYAASKAVSAKPGGHYNPLFIYGNVGIGKTHLLQAIGNEVIKNSHKAKVCYTTSEQLTTEIVQNMQSHNMKKIKEKYRQLDLLIVDDIQFIAHKDRTIEEFFHTFNDLYNDGKQIVLSADRPPQDLNEFEPRMKSRFEMGMTVDIQFPDFETRYAILQQKSRERELMIDPKVFEFIAMNVHHSIRELEGILNQVMADMELKHIIPTVDHVAGMMKKTHSRQTLMGLPKSNDYTVMEDKSPEDVINVICSQLKVSERLVRSDTRKKNVMEARQIIMYLLKEVMDMTYDEIGSFFGGKEHSTVIHACKKVRDLMDANPSVRREINTLQGMI